MDVYIYRNSDIVDSVPTQIAGPFRSEYTAKQYAEQNYLSLTDGIFYIVVDFHK